MTKYDKARRKVLLKGLREAGAQVKFNPDSGVTVATIPSVQGKAKFGRVAFALCSENDKPKRKMGELIAIQNLFDGISFPVKIENWEENWQNHVSRIFSSPGYL